MSRDPRIRDYTGQARPLPVVVEVSPVYEFLLGLFAYQARDDDPDIATDIDSKFFEHVDAHVSEVTKGVLDRLSGCGELWLTLLGVAHAAPEPRTLDEFLAHVAAHDPVELRRRLLSNAGVTPWRGYEIADINAAAAGDPEVLERLLENHDPALARIMALDPVVTRDDLVAFMRRFDDEVPFDEGAVMPVLERDAAAKRALAATMEPAEVVEAATNGVTFEMRPGLQGIVLIPSLVIRPWVIISEHDGLRIFAYPAAEEYLTLDPAAPPAGLVEVYKALGDERRLRILFLLSENTHTLGELAHKLELAKSTTHHHLRILRKAGLIRVIVGDDEKRHEIRRSAVPEIAGLLDSYLTGSSHSGDGA